MWFEMVPRLRSRLFESVSLKYSPPVRRATVSGMLRRRPSVAAMAAIFASARGGASWVRQSYAWPTLLWVASGSGSGSLPMHPLGGLGWWFSSESQLPLG